MVGPFLPGVGKHRQPDGCCADCGSRSLGRATRTQFEQHDRRIHAASPGTRVVAQDAPLRAAATASALLNSLRWRHAGRFSRPPSHGHGRQAGAAEAGRVRRWLASGRGMVFGTLIFRIRRLSLPARQHLPRRLRETVPEILLSWDFRLSPIKRLSLDEVMTAPSNHWHASQSKGSFCKRFMLMIYKFASTNASPRKTNHRQLPPNF